MIQYTGSFKWEIRQINDIFLCGQNFGAITIKIKSDLHKHWLLQLFISAGEKLEISVEGQKISCRAIVVNVNRRKAFYTENSICSTMLVNPVTQLGRSMRMNFIKDKPYYILSEDREVELQRQLCNVTGLGRNLKGDR